MPPFGFGRMMHPRTPPAPVLTSINRKFGSNGGGTTVRATGSGFSGGGASSFHIGTSTLSTFTVINDTTLEGETGGWATYALQDAYVAGPGGNSNTLTGAFYSMSPIDVSGASGIFFLSPYGMTNSGSTLTGWTDEVLGTSVIGGSPGYTASNSVIGNLPSADMGSGGKYAGITLAGGLYAGSDVEVFTISNKSATTTDLAGYALLYSTAVASDYATDNNIYLYEDVPGSKLQMYRNGKTLPGVARPATNVLCHASFSCFNVTGTQTYTTRVNGTEATNTAANVAFSFDRFLLGGRYLSAVDATAYPEYVSYSFAAGFTGDMGATWRTRMRELVQHIAGGTA